MSLVTLSKIPLYTSSNKIKIQPKQLGEKRILSADIALMFAGGVGAAKYLKQLPQILKLLTVGGVATASMTSCSPDDGIGGKTDIKQEVNITITQNSKLEEALDALLEGQKVQTEILQKILEREIENGMTAKEILNICGGNAQLLSKILEAMCEWGEKNIDERFEITNPQCL